MELDSRKQRILTAIVNDYVATAEPVGSHVLLARHDLGVKSATIRNEMAEMSEQGYLRQPHTSAGRVPADRGYRFYVDRLMPLPVINHEEADAVRVLAAQASQELDSIIRRTCQLLASMTKLPVLATAPITSEAELRQLFVSPAGADKALLVLLFSTGLVENRLLILPKLSAGDSLSLANGLNSRFADRTISEISLRNPDEESAPKELGNLRLIWQVLANEIIETVRLVERRLPIYIEGTDALVEQPEFRDVERLGRFLSHLQERAAVAEMLEAAEVQIVQMLPDTTARYPQGVHIRIGLENPHPALSEYTLISSTYFVGDRQRGSIGVLGPTRMDYGRTTAAVGFMARTMGSLLTRLAVAP